MPRTQEDGCVVDPCRDGRKASQQAYDRDAGSKQLLKAGEDDESSNLDAMAVPIQLMLRIDTEPIEIFHADGLNARRPPRRTAVTQDLMAVSMAARRFSISAILSASLVKT